MKCFATSTNSLIDYFIIYLFVQLVQMYFISFFFTHQSTLHKDKSKNRFVTTFLIYKKKTENNKLLFENSNLKWFNIRQQYKIWTIEEGV